MKRQFALSALLWAWLTPLSAQPVRTVPLESMGMAYSPSRNQLYVSVAAGAPQRARTVTIVNPLTGAIGASLPLEAEAWALAISEDERYLYAGLVGGTIVRIDLQGFRRDLDISTEPTGVVDRVIIEIHPFPDRPTSFVASVGQEGFGPGLAVLAVFDGNVMRAGILPPGLGIIRFTFGADSRTLWGYDGSNDAFKFYGLSIDEHGISVSSGPSIGLVYGWVTKLLFREGLLYTSNGRVLDPVREEIQARYYSFEALFALSFAVDWERERVYFASRSGYDFYLAEYDLRTFRRRGSFSSIHGQVHVPWPPEQTLLCGPVLVMGGYGSYDPFITLFPLSLIHPVEPWQRPPEQPLSGEVRRIPLQNNTIIYDSQRNRILASTINWASSIGNSLVPIDPLRGRVGDAAWIGSDPWQMAISDDGQYLYAALYSGFAVERVRLDSLTPDLRIAIRTEDEWGLGRRPSRVAEILPYPGRPESFVAVRAFWPGDQGNIAPQGLGVYDGMQQRPAATGELPYDAQIWSAQWDSTGRSLYAFPYYRELEVNETGVELKSSTPGVTAPVFSSDQMRCQYDFCFTPIGDVIDARSQERLARFAFDVYGPDYYAADFVVPDLDRSLVYFLADLGKRTYGDRRLHIEAFQLPGLQRVGHLYIEDAEPPTGFLIWGGDQLAVSTSDEVILFPMSKLHHRQLGPPPQLADLRMPFRWVFPFIEENWGRFTGFAVSNPSAQPITLRLDGYGADGDPNVVPNNRQQLQLPPRTQWSGLGSEVFEAGTIDNIWFQLGSQKPFSGGFFLFQHGDGLDGATAQQTPSRILYFPRLANAEGQFRGRMAQDQLYLVNPNGFSVRVKVSVVGKDLLPDPAPRTNFIYVNLPAYGSVIKDLGRHQNLVGHPGAYIKAEVFQERGSLFGFHLIRLLDDPQTLIAINPATPAQGGSLFSAQLASGPGIFSNIKLVNTSDEKRQVVLQAVADDGSLLAEPVGLVLEGRDLLEEDADVLFGLPHSSVLTGSLRVEADGPGLIGNVLFGDPQELDYASAVNLDSTTFQEAVFSHVANVDDFFTGLALYNPSDEDAEVVLEVRTAEGALTGSVRFVLARGARLARLLTELVPASAGQAGGYVRVRSTQPLVGQQLFGTTSLSRLACVPAQPIQ